MFTYLLGSVNGLVAQLSYDDNIKSQQKEQLETWLLRLDMVGKKDRLTNEQYQFILDYLEKYWKINIKGLNTDNEFISQLPPSLRSRVILHPTLVNNSGIIQRIYKIM